VEEKISGSFDRRLRSLTSVLEIHIVFAYDLEWSSLLWMQESYGKDQKIEEAHNLSSRVREAIIVADRTKNRAFCISFFIRC
jgi:hypothetical protein